MMGEINKRHNRKIWRTCPVCKGRVIVCHGSYNWWVSCEGDSKHIPQKFFPYAHEAIEQWNVKANKESRADRIRAMTDDELAEYMAEQTGEKKAWWIDWLRQEVDHV